MLSDSIGGLNRSPPDGQVSKQVRAGPGLHVVKAEARRRGGAKTFEEANEGTRTMLAQERSASYRDQYVAELKRDAAIQVNMSELEEGAGVASSSLWCAWSDQERAEPPP